MTNQDLVEKTKQQVVVVGAADIGKYLFDFFRSNCEDVKIVLCDNSQKKQGNFNEYKVISVEKAVESYPHALYLITSVIHENIIRMQLKKLGVSDENILLGVTQEAEEYLTGKKRDAKLCPLERIQFEVDIVSHCNLNCKCCSQFSCIAEEEYIDIENMKKDFKRLGELFNGEAERIYLIGGEPLLHPKITECMKIARRHFPIGKISVFTNGLLLLKCNKEFWSVCRENNISIIVTKYPISLEHQKIVRKAEDEKVKFDFFGTSEDFKYMTNLGLDLEGKQDAIKSFVNCTEANNCMKLRKGKLFTCTRPAAIYRFNKFFGKKLDVVEKDYINIYEAESKDEILNRLAKPIPFCRYCNILRERKAMEWGHTEEKIEEWL